MMEEQLVANLRADPGIAALAAVHNGRPSVDWITRPDTAALPGITIQRVSTDRAYSYAGPISLTGARVQFDVWGQSYGAARTLFRALQDKMEAGGTGWQAFLITERDSAAEEVEGGLRVFNVSADFNLWYEEE